jgi:ubiquinone biosynthesis protein
MERVHGFKITHLAGYSKMGISPKQIAEIGINSFFRQVFINGYFHADPHPGNLFVTPQGKLCFVDFGAMGYISPSDKDALGAIFIGIEIRNSQRIIRALKQLSGTKDIENEEALELRILELVEDYTMLNLKEIKLGDLFLQLRDIIVDFKIVVPPDFFLLGKTLAATEDIGRKLYPEINIIEYLKPYVTKLVRRKMNPVSFLKEMYLPLLDFGSLLQEFPGDLRDIITKLKQGTLKVDIEHMGLHELKITLEKVSNRISLAIITAAMLIGSSLIVLANIPPYYNNIPLLGIIGFLVSVGFAVWLVISIIRGGNI